MHWFEHGLWGSHILPEIFALLQYGKEGSSDGGKARPGGKKLLRTFDQRCDWHSEAYLHLPNVDHRMQTLQSVSGLCSFATGASTLSYADGKDYSALLKVSKASAAARIRLINVLQRIATPIDNLLPPAEQKVLNNLLLLLRRMHLFVELIVWTASRHQYFAQEIVGKLHAALDVRTTEPRSCGC